MGPPKLKRRRIARLPGKMLKIIVRNLNKSIFIAKVDFFFFKNENSPTKHMKSMENVYFQQKSREDVSFCHG